MKISLTPWDKKTDLSIILISWNSWNVIEKCIQTILDQTQGISYEIIVVDNGTTKDDSLTLIAQKFPQVRLLINSKNEGFSRANNQGMAIAQGRYFLVLNNDTYLIENTLEKVVRYMDEHPRVGFLGVQHLNDNDVRDWQPSCFNFPQFNQDIKGLLGISKPVVLQRPLEESTEVDWVCGSFLMLPRKLAETEGVFDERFFAYDEDIDWAYRIKKSGWKISYWQGSSIVHKGCGSGSLLSDKAYMNMRSRLMFYSTHGTFFRGILFYFILLGKLAFGIIKGCFLLVLGKEPKKTFFTRVQRWFQLLFLCSSKRGSA